MGASIIRTPHGQSQRVASALRRSGYFKSVEQDGRAAATQLPNDPEFPLQWGLRKVGAPVAWELTLGSSAVTVAIVDTGVDLQHPDLRGQLVPGYDLFNDDTDPADDQGHGTRMAGIVAAEAFNSAGVAGVAPGCRLMPIKVLGPDGNGSYSTIANGITYAVDHGARVINLSLAGTAPSSLLQSAVDYATARGALVVVSAGNFGSGDPTYPAACNNAVAVSATDETDTVTSFSNNGSWLRLAAPGTNVMTTSWSASGGSAYGGTSGTSPAAAFASGAFALLLSAHPELSPSEAVDRMTGAAHDLGVSGWDPFSGWGRVDVAAALGVAQSPSPAPSPAPVEDRLAPVVRITSPVSNSLLYGVASVDAVALDDVGVTAVDLMVDGSVVASDTAPPFGFVWDTTPVNLGLHTLRVRASDAAGHSKLSKAVHVYVTPGVGLLIKHARLPAPVRPGLSGATVSLRAVFVLPDGAVLDQTANSFAAALRSAKGPVFVTAASNAFAALRGRARFTVAAADGSGAIFKVRIAKLRRQPNFSLSIFATGLSVANADSIMSLSLVINGFTLSQSASLRLHRGSLVFP